MLSYVLIRNRGTEGRESEPPVFLHARVDMACSVAEGVVHDHRSLLG